MDRECERLGVPKRTHFTAASIDYENSRLALADAVFSPGPFTTASIKAHSTSPLKFIETSYGAPQAHAATPERSPKPRFIFMGSDWLRKGMASLLDAWRMADIDAELHLYGSDERAQFPDLPQGVHYVGFTKDIASAFCSADVFVFPSLEEGDPQVTYEAASYGLPLLVTEMGGGRIARHDENAVVIAPNDTGALAAALRRLAADPALRGSLGAQAKRDQQTHFTWAAVAHKRLAQLEGLYGGLRPA